MNYINSFNLLGVEARQRPCLLGNGAPGATLTATIGELYMDTNSGVIYKCTAVVDGVCVWVSEISYSYGNVISVNHRGYNTIAPENTLSAFRLSKLKGYNYVECDVSFTLDDVPVLLHDDTIDRTSNGTGSISGLTLSQARSYDYGSWKSAEYIGEKIPTFEEFMLLCKNIGLHPYIEVKSSLTDEQATILVDIVKAVGMIGNVTWISFQNSSLTKLVAIDGKSRIGYLLWDINDSNTAFAKSLKTDNNYVFIDCYYVNITNAKANLCKDNNLGLELWTMNDELAIKSIPSYVTGVTTDVMRVDKILFDDNISHNKYIEYVESEWEVVRTLTADEILDGKSFSADALPAIVNNPMRSGYYTFDIPVERGYVYKFDFEATVQTAQIGVHIYNNLAATKFANGEIVGANNYYDSGWQENGVEVSAPDTINGETPAFVLMVFRMATTNPVVVDDFITSVTISRKRME